MTSPTRTNFRAAMARLPAAVNILTTNGPNGRCGITVSAVCSVTDMPPTILVCVNQSSAMHEIVNGNGRVCVNVLAGTQEGLAQHFSGSTGTPMAERFSWNIWAAEEFVPVLKDAAVTLIGTIGDRKSMGSHSVFFVNVERVRMRPDGDSLIYVDRRFRQVPETGGPGPD